MAVKSELSEQKLGYIRELVNAKDPKEEYKLIESIGTGTYGEVYKALRLRTKEIAAVKIIKIDGKDDVRAILQEIQTLRDCKHPNIVQFFGSYFRNNKLWICMEFCGGFSMQDIYTNIRRPIEENCIAFVTRETLRGIEYMHKAGKIHRDIKGANILLTNDGDVKIADFGVAAQITQTIQRRNSFIGTPYWMAPEVAAVERKGGYDEKCDIWALGITAMEYAELQPPLFDLHPMKALRILGMRSYKPPTLRNKAAWSSKFHNFLKAALTKSEKKRPTAQVLLRHELVTQPYLTRALTVRLLELNRNPDRLLSPSVNAVSAAPKPLVPQAAQDPSSKGPASPALLVGRPDVLHIAQPTSSSDSTEREFKGSPGDDPENTVKRKPSVGSTRRPQPPWTGQTVFSTSDSVPSGASTPVASPVSKTGLTPASKMWTPAERIFPVRHSSSAEYSNGYQPTSNDTEISQKDGNLKSLLEKIRIMDELPTPLPAYVPMAPTATPAVKPSGECIPFAVSGKSPKLAPSAPHSHKPVEALVQQIQITPSLNSPPTPVVIQASSASTHSDTSSCASASTSPRSSCSSLILEAVQQAEQRSHCNNGNHDSQHVLMSNHVPTNGKELASKQENGEIVLEPVTVAVDEPRPDHLTVFEPVVLQDSLEAEFVPIDADALLLSPKPAVSQSNRQLSAHRESNSLSGRSSLGEVTPNDKLTECQAPAPLELKESDFSSDSDESRGSDYDDEDYGEDDLSDDDDKYSERSHITHGTVTTLESSSSESSRELPSQNTERDEPSNVSNETAPTQPLTSTDEVEDAQTKTQAPRASVENPDEWDLIVADDELLANDGLLLFNRNGPDSTSDRISEFGFRIHGDSDGEDEVDEDDADDEDLLGEDKNPLVIPEKPPDLRADLPIPQAVGTDLSRNPAIVTDHLKQTEVTSQTNHQPPSAPKKLPTDFTCEPEALKEFYPDKSGEELMALLRQLKFAQKFAWLSGSSVPLSTLAALTAIHSTKLSLNGDSQPNHKTEAERINRASSPDVLPSIALNGVSKTPEHSVTDHKPPSVVKSNQIAPAQQPLFLASVECAEEPLSEDVSPIHTPPTVSLLPMTQTMHAQLAKQHTEADIQGLSSFAMLNQSLEQMRTTIATPVASHPLSEDLNQNASEFKGQVEHNSSPSVSPPNGLVPGPKKLSHLMASNSLRSEGHVSGTQPTTCSMRCLTSVGLEASQPPIKPVSSFTNGTVSTSPSGDRPNRMPMPPPLAESTVICADVNLWNSTFELNQLERNDASSGKTPVARVKSVRSRSRSNTDTPTSRLSMVELSRANERPLYTSSSGIPPTPQVNMGACFSLVFEGCPLKINCTATWVNPANNGQVLLFGTNDGIYYLSLKDLADSSLELLFPRRCLWLSVVRDTMMSLSGRHPQLYCHNLISLMKLKSQGHMMGGNPSKLGKLTKLFPKRFSPSKKIPDTKGCRRVSVTRSPFNGAKYLCAAIGNEILVMEWFNPVSSFIKIKRILVPDMPSPLLTFDLLILKDRPLPLVCLGVYRHHSRQGRENKRYRLQLVDLNSTENCTISAPGTLGMTSRRVPNGPQAIQSMVSSQISEGGSPGAGNGEERKLLHRAECQKRNAIFLPEDSVPVVEVVQLEHKTILVCLQDCAKVISLNGRIKSSRHRATTLDFNGSIAESIVCLRDSVLVFHPHGLLGKNFTGELTQEINDMKHIYRLLGCDRNIVVESRPADDPMSNSNVYLLAGHADSRSQ